jgi:hypothetical protein
MSASLPAPWPELRNGDLKSAALLDRLQLSLRRDDGECRLDYRFLNARMPESGDDDPERPPFVPQFSVRYLLEGKTPALTLEPLLADRAVVSRPLISVELPPQHSATLLISTPLWVRLRNGDLQLVELPTARLSDTWFGSNTRHGELCYAVQTRARLSLENTSDSPFRALTPVTITNSGGDNLKLDRINVPVPHLSLYCDGERFWTSAITIERERNWVSARVQIGDGAPPQAPEARKIAEPRRPIRGGVLERAVDLLFA